MKAVPSFWWPVSFLATYKRWLSFQVGISSRAKFHMDSNSASGCVRGPGAVEREGGEIL